MQLFTFALFVLCIACSQLETAWAGSNNGASLASARLKATSPLTVAKKTKLPTSLLSRDDMSLPHVEDVSSTLAMREKLFLLRAGSSGDFDWRYFVAGGVCAACSHGITTPLGKFYCFNCTVSIMTILLSLAQMSSKRECKPSRKNIIKAFSVQHVILLPQKALVSFSLVWVQL